MILAMILAALLLAGVAYENYRGAPKTAEIVITHHDTTPFDATNTFQSRSTPLLNENARPESPESNTDQNQQRLLIFLNTASLTQLQELPGVGEVLASRIFERKTDLGQFSSIQQVLEVSGIGTSKLETMIQYIRTKKGTGTLNPHAVQHPGRYRRLPPSSSLVFTPLPKRPQLRSLNRVTQQELLEISGIGPALADAILNARHKRGPFRSWQEVDQISGIGEHRLQQLKNHFTVP